MRAASQSNKKISLAIGILLIATCLRAPFTSMGPLLEMVQNALKLSTAATGSINTLPLLSFALISPLAPAVSRRLGLEIALGIALALVGGGVLLRAAGQLWSLYIGTGCIGCGIAIGNVLLPSLVKRDFPLSIPRVTALYALTMGISAALGSMVMVPLAGLSESNWQYASTILFLLPLTAAIAWVPQIMARNTSGPVQTRTLAQVSLWKSPLAWQVTCFFALTSLTYYIGVSWLPALLLDAGFTDTEAGSIHGLMQLASAFPGLVIVPIISRMKDQRPIAFAVGAISGAGALGLATFPALGILWGICIGFGGGAAITLALMFIGLRTVNTSQAASLSGMAQSLGYLCAACGPIGAGALHDSVHSWQAIFYVSGFLCLLLSISGLWAGRAIRIGE